MALRDYVLCAVCQQKAIYDDGNDTIRDSESEFETLCTDCVRTHRLLALPKGTTAELLAEIRKGLHGADALRAFGALSQILLPGENP